MIGIEGEKVSEVTRLRVWKSDLWAGTGQTHSHPDATSVVLASDYEKLEAERNMWLETAHKAAHASGLLGGSVIPETLEGHITKRIAELEAEVVAWETDRDRHLGNYRLMKGYYGQKCDRIAELEAEIIHTGKVAKDTMKRIAELEADLAETVMLLRAWQTLQATPHTPVERVAFAKRDAFLARTGTTRDAAHEHDTAADAQEGV